MIGCRPRRGAAALLAVSTVAGCGLLGDSSSSTPATSGPLELASIKVSVLQVIDTAPLWRAIDAGYFAAEGLTVEPVPARSGPDAVLAVASGSTAIGLTSYPASFNAQAQNLDPGGLRLVADGYAATKNSLMVVAAPDSGIREFTPQDLAGRHIAVSESGTVSDLATMATLEIHGVDPTTITWDTIPFEDMIPALRQRDVDAAVMVEPWITHAQMQLGNAAPLVMDCATAGLEEIPLAGWVASTAFVDQYPKTVEVFRRGLARAVDDVQDRLTLHTVLVDHLGIDETVAALPTLAPGRFVSTLNKTRLDRVVQLMHRYPHVSKLPADFDLSPMLIPPARR